MKKYKFKKPEFKKTSKILSLFFAVSTAASIATGCDTGATTEKISEDVYRLVTSPIQNALTQIVDDASDAFDEELINPQIDSLGTYVGIDNMDRIVLSISSDIKGKDDEIIELAKKKHSMVLVGDEQCGIFDALENFVLKERSLVADEDVNAEEYSNTLLPLANLVVAIISQAYENGLIEVEDITKLGDEFVISSSAGEIYNLVRDTINVAAFSDQNKQYRRSGDFLVDGQDISIRITANRQSAEPIYEISYYYHRNNKQTSLKAWLTLGKGFGFDALNPIGKSNKTTEDYKTFLDYLHKQDYLKQAGFASGATVDLNFNSAGQEISMEK